MRLCAGTYLKVLSLCAYSGKNKEIVKGLAKTIDPDGDYDIDDQTVNKLLRCDYDLVPKTQGRANSKKRFSDIADIARDPKTKASDCAERFTDNVIGLLDVDMKAAAIIALRNIVENDGELDAKKAESFRTYVEMTKAEFLSTPVQSLIEDLPKVLTGLFLYCATLGDNRIGRGCGKSNADCPVLAAIVSAGQRSDKHHVWKPEYRAKVDEAIAECKGGCVVRITKEWIDSLASEYKEETEDIYVNTEETKKAETVVNVEGDKSATTTDSKLEMAQYNSKFANINTGTIGEQKVVNIEKVENLTI